MKTKTKQLAETYDYIFQGDVQKVEVTVHINYIDGHISLMEKKISYRKPTTLAEKQYKFSNRGLKYMQSWQDVLTGMKHAIADATEKLRSYQEAEEAEREKNLVKAFIEDVKE